MQRRSSRIRELTTRGTALLLRDVEVARVCGLGGRETEPARGLLDPRATSRRSRPGTRASRSAPAARAVAGSSLLTAMFARRTATLSATTPTSRTANDDDPDDAAGERGALPRGVRGHGCAPRRGRGRPADRRRRDRRRANQSTAAIYASRLDRGAQPRRRRARVRRELGRARPDRPALDRAQLRLVAADADREVGRARAAALLLAQELLDDPVLERVERDHREPAARPEHLERRGQRRRERAELVVHRDPQRLEDALRGMPLAEPRGRGDRALDRVHELARPLERLLLAPPDDRARDLLRVPLFAVAAEDRRRARARATRSRCRGRAQLLRGVHAHVERRVDRVREAALGPVELHRGDAEVEQDRVGLNAVRRRAAAGRRRSRRAGGAPCTPERFSKRSKYVRAVGSRSIAISLPRPCRSAASSAAWPPAPNVASTTVSPGRTREGLAHLVRENGDVISRAGLQDVRQHPLHSLRPRRARGARRRDPRSRGGRGRPRRRRRGRASRARAARPG